MGTPQDIRWCWGVLSRTGLSTEEGDMVSWVDMGNLESCVEGGGGGHTFTATK